MSSETERQEIEGLKREIEERQARIDELDPPVTLKKLEGMTPREIADLPTEVVHRAMGKETA